MLSRHDAAVRSPLLAARGRLRWRLCDVLEYGAVFVIVITCKLSPGDPGTANDVRSQRETSIHNKKGSVARARVSLIVPYHTRIAAPILLGIAGQIALKSAANGSATVIAQFLNPLTIIGLAILSSPPSATSWPSKRFQSQSPSRRGSPRATRRRRARAYPLERAPRLAADGWHCDDRRRRSAGSPALRKPA
jgi:hypothetical protein